MRKFRAAVLAGVAALCAAGTALAASNDIHVMTVDLPDGSVARIEYRGDVAPKVQIDRATGFTPVRFVDPFDAAPFAMFDRIFGGMDRQAAAMMRQARTLAPFDGDGKPDLAAFKTLPTGSVSSRFVSTSDGNRFCSRSWQWTSQGSGQQPKLVTASAGDCDTANPAKHRLAPAKAVSERQRASGPTV